jgi:hypothetical protein
MKARLCTIAFAAMLLTAATAAAQEPVENIGDRHGNLRSAQELIRQAYDRLGEAQQANNSDLGGHAAKAKELLRQASEEIRLAADTANQHGR